VGEDLAKHLTDNATKHLGTLGGASGKYAVLTRILAIAQRVEAHLTSSEVKPTEALPLGSITGAGLIQLLQERNWVNSTVGSKVACEHFLQLQLMKRVSSGGALNDHVFHHDATTVYSFLFPTQSSTAPPSSSSSSSSAPPPHSSHAPTEFEPHNFGRGFVPTESILHALSPQNFPGQPEMKEISE
jgi:hypothetical protein